MKQLLVCTIMRNQHANVERWWDLLGELARYVRRDGWDVQLSVAENDSTDGTAEWLRERHQCTGADWYLSTETLGTQQYGSVWSVDRLRNLAAARQKCLDQAGAALLKADKVAYIEPDVTYDPHWCRELILARHPRAAGFEPDIYSGWSLRSETNPKESVFLYDVCATRAGPEDRVWDIIERGGKWRGETVVPTDLGGTDSMCLHPVWSTFNCFCVYNAEPFRRRLKWNPAWGPLSYVLRRLRWIDRLYNPALRWGHVNPRLDTGQERIDAGWCDADTAVICESFRAAGYDKVYLNTNCLVRHT